MPTLLGKGSKGAGFRPRSTEEPTTPLQSLRSYMDSQATRSKYRCEARACRSSSKQIPSRFRSSPARLVRCIKAKVGRAFNLFSAKQHSCSRGGVPDAIPMHFIPPRESHHSEALEDCIEFINSSHRKSLELHY